MATYRKRGSTWSYQIVYKDPATGKRRYKSKGGFARKKDCMLAAAEIEKELSDKTYIEERKITFGEFALEWFKEYEANAKKPSTARARYYSMQHLIKAFGAVQIQKITPRLYKEVIYSLYEQGVSYNTLAGIHSVGRMIFRKAMEERIIKIDPTEYVTLPKKRKTIEDLETEKEIPKYMEKEQLNKFLAAAKEHGLDIDYYVFLLMSYSGCRVGEIVALKWSDFDFQNNHVTISKTYYNPNNRIKEFQLLPPKNSAKRTIILDQFVMEEMKKLKRIQNEFRLETKKPYYNEGFVFVDTRKAPGYPVLIKTVESRMRRLIKLCLFDENLTPHSLRHTHTSLCAEAGVSLEEIMDRLGHKNDQITRSVYLHVTKSRKKEAANKFSDLMKRVREEESV
ncbi:site-specific integrase [Bacillus sp. FSL K6-6483]|uniref:site-specific integrase n=1 Tax=Shouchella clausii TaxID=79880 RepID=UPI000BA7784B|nr:site-specific integrase [Shouchella clausii]PAF08710.1 hypothetical protein CHH65_14075 [Shouchella clausii]